MSMLPEREEPGPGRESVWDYPRPPRLEPVGKRIQVFFGGEEIANTTAAWRVLETSHPPVYYIPPLDIRMECLIPAGRGSMCEWKGSASYYAVTAAGRTAERAAWTYPSPAPAFAPIKNFVAFYPAAMDECRVDGELARPQPGGFYGGWITNDIAGPFKGAPGSMFW